MKDEKALELTWQEYESITRYIYETLGAEFGIKVKGYGKDCKIFGKSTVPHQIDVLTEQMINGESVLTAIECKFLKKKVTKETVMKLHSIMLDAGIATGIIVSRKGFTKDTLTYAEHVGIRLVELREGDIDECKQQVTLGTLEIHNKVIIKRPKIISIDLGSIQITDENEIMKMYINGYASILTSKDRIPFHTYLFEYAAELRKQEKFLKTINMDFPPIKGKFLRMHDDFQYDIEKIRFTGFLCEIDASSSRSFDILDQVWLIMKQIFENKGYKLTKFGFLIEDIN
ncbi:restriction endonuclease [Sphingobacterium thalpophilum]|uniref:restriction endonuclease n=1 Tax=Sphingobacterium thalpophilum TaxID=259 RepID=UPI0037D9A93C